MFGTNIKVPIIIRDRREQVSFITSGLLRTLSKSF